MTTISKTRDDDARLMMPPSKLLLPWLTCAAWVAGACGGSAGSGPDADRGDAGGTPSDAGADGDGGTRNDGGQPVDIDELDDSFGAGGMATVNVAPEQVTLILGAAEQTDGKLVFVGRNREGVVLARMTTDGALDPAFGVVAG